MQILLYKAYYVIGLWKPALYQDFTLQVLIFVQKYISTHETKHVSEGGIRALFAAKWTSSWSL